MKEAEKIRNELRPQPPAGMGMKLNSSTTDEGETVATAGDASSASGAEHQQLDAALSIFSGAQSDEERFVSLLLVTRTPPAGAQSVRRVFDTIGLVFPLRLLRSPAPQGTGGNLYLGVALGIFATYTTDPELAAHPDMIDALEIVLDCFGSEGGADDMVEPGTSTQQQEGREGPIPTSSSAASPAASALEGSPQELLALDALQFMIGMVSSPEGRQTMLLCGGVATVLHMLQRGYHQRCAGLCLKLLVSLVPGPGGGVRCSSATLNAIVEGIASTLHSSVSAELTFEALEALACTLDTVLDLYDAAGAAMASLCRIGAPWVPAVAAALSHLLRNKLSSRHRDAAMRVGAAMLIMHGSGWATSIQLPTKGSAGSGGVDAGGDDEPMSLFGIMTQLASVEARMILEEPELSSVVSKGAILPSLCVILEETLRQLVMTSDTDTVGGSWMRSHSALQGAMGAFLTFLNTCRREDITWDTDDHRLRSLLIGSLRIISAWLAEETSALREEVLLALPYVLDLVCQQCAFSSSGISALSPLRQLLPALCHLTADEETLSVVMESRCIEMVADALKSTWLPDAFVTVGPDTVPSDMPSADDAAAQTVITACGMLLNVVVVWPLGAAEGPGYPPMLTVLAAAVAFCQHPGIGGLPAVHAHMATIAVYLLRRDLHRAAGVSSGGILRAGFDFISAGVAHRQSGSDGAWDDIQELWAITCQVLIAEAPKHSDVGAAVDAWAAGGSGPAPLVTWLRQAATDTTMAACDGVLATRRLLEALSRDKQAAAVLRQAGWCA